MNKIITLANVGYKIDDSNFIKNLNLEFFSGENVLISGKDNVISNLLIDLITGYVKPQIGTVKTQTFDDKRYFIGYNNFEAVLKHSAPVQEIINTLISSQRHLVNDNDEVNELIGLFGLDKLFLKSTNELNSDQLFLLNLLMLLIVKPRIIILKQLPLIGSTNFRLSILKYLYNYAKKYDISLILTTDNKMITDNLVDRQLIIEDCKVVSDVSVSIIANYATNSIDNKTKQFDLENVLINALNSSYQKTDNEQDDNDIPSEYIKTKTQPLDVGVSNNSFFTNNTILNNPTKADVTTNSNSTTKSSSTTKTIPTKPTMMDDLVNYNSATRPVNPTKPTTSSTQNIYSQHTTNLNANNRTSKNPSNYLISDEDLYKFNTSAIENEEPETKPTSSFATKPVTSPIKHTTTKIVPDPNFVSQKLAEITRQLDVINDQEENPDQYFTTTNLTNTHLYADKLGETQAIKNALDTQIKSPEFSDLSIQLQSQILDNYEKANELLENNAEHLDEIAEFNNASITKALLQEQQEIYTPTHRATHKTSMIEETIDNASVSKTKTHKLKTKAVNPDVAFDESDLFYYDNEKPNSVYDLWRKKQNTNSFEPLANDEFVTEDTGIELVADQIDNFTKNLNKEKTYARPSTQITIDDETDNIDADEPSEQLLNTLNRKTTNITTPIKQFDTHEYVIEQPVEEPKPIKILPIKSRSKLNSIDKLYQEALEDLTAVEELKQQNNQQ